MPKIERGEKGGVAKLIARYVALAALFIVPLVPLLVANHYFFPFITGKAFYFRLVIEIAVAAWLVLAFLDKRYRPRFSWILIAVLAFVVWMGIADLAAVNVAKAFTSNYERMEGWVLLIHLLALFVVASSVLRVEKKWRTWFLISLGVGLLVSLHGVLQLIDPAKFPIHQGSTRIDSSFGNSAYFAIYLLFNTFISLWLAITEKKHIWLRYVLVIFAALEVFLLFMTETRGAVLGIIGALILSAILFVATGKSKKMRVTSAIALVIIIVLAGGTYLARNSSFVQHNHVLQRVTSINLADGQVRFEIWGMAWQGFKQDPKTVLLGWGQEGFNYIFNEYYNPNLYTQEPWFDRAHNAFIDWLTAGGAPAFFLYLALFVSAIVLIWKAKDLTRGERIFLTAALAGYACHNFFVFDNLYSYVYFFIILAFISSHADRPIAAFERWPELSEPAGALYALPVAAIALIATGWLVNGPGMRTASELIHAITPSQTGDYSQNLATFEDIIKHPGFAKQEIREQLVEFAVNVAQDPTASSTVQEQLISLAVQQMQKQVQSYPQDARERLQLSYAYNAEGDTADALAQIQAAEKLSPNKEAIWIQEGLTDLNTGDMQAAKKAFDTAYQLGPQFSGIAPYAAAGNIVNGDVAGGRQILQNAFGTTTVDSDILSFAYYHAQDWSDLIALWQMRVAKSATSDPATAINAWFGLATSYYVAGQKTKAIDTINEATKEYPTYANDGATLIAQMQSDAPVQ